MIMMKHRIPGRLALLTVATGLACTAPVASRAQSFALRVVASPTVTLAGGAVTFKVYLDAAPASHNYTSARGFLVYGQATGTSADSPLTSIAFAPASDKGGFQNAGAAFTNPDVTVTKDGTAYRGLSFYLYNGSAVRKDSGTFLLGTVTAQLRSDLAAGSYTVAPTDVPVLRGRSRVLGDIAYAAATTLQSASFTVLHPTLLPGKGKPKIGPGPTKE